MPYVPKIVWEHITAEVAYLRAQLQDVREHDRRIERVERGLYEIAPQPRERDPVPESLVKLCAKFSASGRGLLEDAKRERSAGRSWDEIEEAILSDIERQAGIE